MTRSVPRRIILPVEQEQIRGDKDGGRESSWKTVSSVGKRSLPKCQPGADEQGAQGMEPLGRGGWLAWVGGG